MAIEHLEKIQGWKKKGREQIRGSDDPKALQGLYHKLKAKMNEYKSIKKIENGKKYQQQKAHAREI